MSGSLLSLPGDVQLGADDASPVLLRLGPPPETETRRSSMWVTRQFVPFPPIEMPGSDSPLMIRPGVLQGSDVPTMRKCEVEVRVHGSDAADVQAKLGELSTATAPLSVDQWGTNDGLPAVQHELAWMSPTGKKYVLFGRFRGVGGADVSLYRLGKLTVKVRFEGDPVIYECDPVTVNLGAPLSGFAPVPFNPVDVPWAATSATATAITPGGDASPRWSVEFDGGVQNPVLWAKERAQGRWRVAFLGLGNAYVGPASASIVTARGVRIPRGQTWVLDSGTRTVTARRRYAAFNGGTISAPHVAAQNTSGGNMTVFARIAVPGAWGDGHGGGPRWIASKGTEGLTAWAFGVQRDSATTTWGGTNIGRLTFRVRDTGGTTYVWMAPTGLPPQPYPAWVMVRFLAASGVEFFATTSWSQDTPPPVGSPVWVSFGTAGSPITMQSTNSGPVTIGGLSPQPATWQGGIHRVIVRDDVAGVNVIDWRPDFMSGSPATGTDGTSVFTASSASAVRIVDGSTWESPMATLGSSWFELPSGQTTEVAWSHDAAATNVLDPASNAATAACRLVYRRGWWLPG